MLPVPSKALREDEWQQPLFDGNTVSRQQWRGARAAAVLASCRHTAMRAIENPYKPHLHP
jgi:hypothetical protein